MLRFSLILTLVVLICGAVFGQEPVIRQHWQTQYMYNPAAGATEQKHEFSAGLNYLSYFEKGNGWLNYAQQVNNRHIVGLNAGFAGFGGYNYYEQEFISVSYAYKIPLQNNAALQVGFSPKYLSSNMYDGISLHADRGLNKPKRSFLTADAGLFFTQNGFYAGLACKNIYGFSLTEYDFTNALPFVSNFSAGYRFYVEKDKIEMQPSVLIQSPYYIDDYIIDLNNSFTLMNKMTVGVSYRRGVENESGQSASVNISVKIINKLQIGLAADFYTSEEQKKGGEIFAGFSF